MAEREKIRLDKWLWAARFFKTRSLASAAINGGKVHVDGQRVKSARAVKIGDTIDVWRGPDRYTIEVKALADRRGPAKVAQQLYEETPESIEARAEAALRRKLEYQGARPAPVRPSGRDRRRIRSLAGKD